MHELDYLWEVLILLGVSIANVFLSRILKLSPVLGYLVIGATIGEHGFKLVENTQYAQGLSEFGVVFLLFAIGLELTFERLVQMRVLVFGFGGLQFVLTSAAIAYVMHAFLQLDFVLSIFLGFALSLSSTAIVLQVLNENKRQSTQVGRISLATLLLQDFAVVPLLSVLPLISNGHVTDAIWGTLGMAGFKALVAIVIITLLGRMLLRPFLTVIGSAKSEEIYVASTLFIVLGSAALTAYFGLSTAMGAFIAGILIAETEYRNRVEDNIFPFKSLLLGLFFLSVGMSIDFKYIISQVEIVLLYSIGLIVLKAAIVFIICKLFRIGLGASLHSALLLSQGGEFAFILFSLAAKDKFLPPDVAQLLLVVVAFTMAITPLLSIIGMYIEDKIDAGQDRDKNQEFRGISDLEGHIIIAGFGRVGRVIAFMLSEMQFNYVAVDNNLSLVKKARAHGFPVYHGDLSSLDVLRAVGAERAKVVILTMSEKDSLRKNVKAISANYKTLEIISRAEDYKHGKNLKKLGADAAVPSTIETGLQLGSFLLKTLDIAEHEINDIKDLFRRHDYSFTQEIELFSGISPSKKIDSD